MGGCCAKIPSPFEEFTVTNINDQHRLVHSGSMFVTETNLIFIDKSHKRWEWPLRYIRRYGCEESVFSFEVGRKYSGGEGLYAFNCKRASDLLDRVAHNSSHGNLKLTEPELPEGNPLKMQQHTPSNVPNDTTRYPNSAVSPGENDAQVQTLMGEPNYVNISVGTKNQDTYGNKNIGVRGGGMEQEQNHANIMVGTEEHNYTSISVQTGEVPEVPTSRPSISGVLHVDSEHNYTNTTVGSGAAAAGVGRVDTEHNYTNVSVGTDTEESQRLVSSTPVTTATQRISSSLSHAKPSGAMPNSTQTLPHIKGGGNYIELDFNSQGSPSMRSYVELDVGGYSTMTLLDELQTLHSAFFPTVPAIGHTIPEDTHDTLYIEVNFKEMEALHKLGEATAEGGQGHAPTHVELSEKELEKQ